MRHEMLHTAFSLSALSWSQVADRVAALLNDGWQRDFEQVHNGMVYMRFIRDARADSDQVGQWVVVDVDLASIAPVQA